MIVHMEIIMYWEIDVGFGSMVEIWGMREGKDKMNIKGQPQREVDQFQK